MTEEAPYKTGQVVEWVNEKGTTCQLTYVAGLWSTAQGLLYDEIQLNDIGWSIAPEK
jgi:hypothetical protein